jgi:hypothetical protein
MIIIILRDSCVAYSGDSGENLTPSAIGSTLLPLPTPLSSALAMVAAAPVLKGDRILRSHRVVELGRRGGKPGPVVTTFVSAVAWAVHGRWKLC